MGEGGPVARSQKRASHDDLWRRMRAPVSFIASEAGTAQALLRLGEREPARDAAQAEFADVTVSEGRAQLASHCASPDSRRAAARGLSCRKSHPGIVTWVCAPNCSRIFFLYP